MTMMTTITLVSQPLRVNWPSLHDYVIVYNLKWLLSLARVQSAKVLCWHSWLLHVQAPKMQQQQKKKKTGIASIRTSFHIKVNLFKHV